MLARSVDDDNIERARSFGSDATLAAFAAEFEQRLAGLTPPNAVRPHLCGTIPIGLWLQPD